MFSERDNLEGEYGSAALFQLIKDLDSGKEVIRMATRYLAGLPFKGAARGRLPFPRTGCSESGGPTIGDSEIPWRYQEAACMLALKALAGPLLEDSDTGIRSVKAGPVSVEFEPGQTLTTSYTEAEALLAPLLRADNALDIAPIFISSTKPPAV